MVDLKIILTGKLYYKCHKKFIECVFPSGIKRFIRSDTLKAFQNKVNKINNILNSYKDIKETKYIGYYASSTGDIIGKNGNVLKGEIDKCGYQYISINGQLKLAHRIILETFNYKEGYKLLDVNHKDGIKTNNDIKNLEWCTRSENIIHSYANGLQDNATNQYGNFKVVTKKIISFIEGAMDSHTQIEISKMTGYSTRTIRKYVKRIREGYYNESRKYECI